MVNIKRQKRTDRAPRRVANDPDKGSFVHSFKRLLVALVPNQTLDKDFRSVAIGFNEEEERTMVWVALQMGSLTDKGDTAVSHECVDWRVGGEPLPVQFPSM